MKTFASARPPHLPRRPHWHWLVPLCLATAAGGAWAHGKAHVHGIAKLDVALEGQQLTLAFTSPLDNLLGFEHRPRTDAQKRAAETLLTRMKDLGSFFKPDPAAACTAAAAQVEAPTLSGAPAAGAKGEEHADLAATVVFTCSGIDKLAALEHTLFPAYPRLTRIEVQVAGPRGQLKQTLQRPARTLRLGR